MSLEISGKITQILEKQSGESARGLWQKQEFVIETFDQYPKNVCITLWGDKVEVLNSLPKGSTVKASINIESREYKGRWYTDVKAWKVESLNQSEEADVPPSTPADDAPIPPDFQAEGNGEEDLPF